MEFQNGQFRNSLHRVPPDSELDTDDENDEEEHPEIPVPLSPFPYISGNGRLRWKDAVALHWIRSGWILVFLVFYCVTVNKRSNYRDILGAEMQLVMAQFSMNARLSRETASETFARVAYGEVAPQLVEKMDANEIAKLLNRFQMFCMNKRGSDDHVAFSWHCDIADLQIRKEKTRRTIEWDFINNAPLTTEGKEKAEASKEMERNMCADGFIKKHFIRGDDPRVVPWGDVEAFRRDSLGGQQLHVVFDEFWEHEQSPLIRSLQAAEENAMASNDDKSARLKKCRKSTPYGAQACKQASLENGFMLGGLGHRFANRDIPIKGCYGYISGPYKGHAYYGIGGNISEMKGRPGNQPTRARPQGYDLGCRRCVPFSVEACRQAARRACLQLGAEGSAAAKEKDAGINFQITFLGTKGYSKGCYTYEDGKYKGMTFYGLGGTEAQMKAPLPVGKVRPPGYDCGGCGEASEQANEENAMSNNNLPPPVPAQTQLQLQATEENAMPNNNLRLLPQPHPQLHLQAQPQPQQTSLVELTVKSEEDIKSRSRHATATRQRSSKVNDNDLGSGVTTLLLDTTRAAADSLRVAVGRVNEQNPSVQSTKPISFLGALNHPNDPQGLLSINAVSNNEAPDDTLNAADANKDSNALFDEKGLTVRSPYGDYELPIWCFEGNLITVLGRALADYDIAPGEKVSKTNLLKIAKTLGVKDHDYLWKRASKNDTDSVTWKDLMMMGVNDRAAFVGARPPLLATCRNHHWGAWVVCGFDKIYVSFSIELANKENLNQGATEKKMQQELAKKEGSTYSHNGRMNRRGGINVRIEFEEIGKDPAFPERAGPTGFYEVKAGFHSWDLPGLATYPQMVSEVLAIILFLLIFSGDFLWTVLKLPFALRNVYRLETRLSLSSMAEVHEILLDIIDARGVLRQFMGPITIALEQFCSLLFVISVYMSIDQTFLNQIGMLGSPPNQECADMFRSGEMDWYEQEPFLPLAESSKTQADANMLSTYDYVAICLKDDPNVNVPLEILHSLVFGYIRWHAVTFFFICMRLLVLLQSVESFTWFFNAMQLSVTKLLSFFLIYCLVIGTFAAFFTTTYGGVFDQFSTFTKAFLTVALFTVGDTERLLAGVHTWTGVEAYMVTAASICLGLMLLAIVMNIFSSVVVEAYHARMNPEHYRSKMFDMHLSMSKWICSRLFHNVHGGGPEAQTLALMSLREYYLSYMFKPAMTKEDQKKAKKTLDDGSTPTMEPLDLTFLTEEVQSLKDIVRGMESAHRESEGTASAAPPAPALSAPS